MKQQNQFYTDRALAERYQVSRQTIWRWVREGHLPKPVKIGTGSTRWPESEILKFEEEACE